MNIHIVFINVKFYKFKEKRRRNYEKEICRSGNIDYSSGGGYLYEKIILEKDKLAFTSKAKIKDYKVDYESIRNMGEKIFARLIINNNEKANIEILMSDDAQQVEEVGHSEEVDKILESEEE